MFMGSIVSLRLPLSLNLKKSSTQHENGVALLREKWVWRCRNGRALVEKTLLLLSLTACRLAICGQEIRRCGVKF